jgi:hypothetical protein
MRRFWITFEPHPGHFPMGFGVTAHDEADAMNIVREWCQDFDPRIELPSQVNVEPDVDVSKKHADGNLPVSHFGIPSNRGLWYPRVNIGSNYPVIP